MNEIGTRKEVPLGLVGLGGFGKWILQAIRKLEDSGRCSARLLAVCEPAQELHAEAIAELKRKGITVVGDFKEMLNLPIQALWMPVPIHLHRPFTEAAVAAGKWVICEKPAAGILQDVDAMIAARDRHHGKVAIAFQDIHERATPLIKQRLLEGVLGRINRISITALWPRPAAYYARNDWAGRLRRGNTWILDCPATNANAHTLNLALYLLGPDLRTSATPATVEAEMYRARDIESADTTCIRATTTTEAQVLFLATHACESHRDVEMICHGEKGELHISPIAAEFRLNGCQTISIPRTIEIERSAEVAIQNWIGGADSQTPPLATLEMAYRHAQVVNGSFDAGPIHTIDSRYIQSTGTGNDLQPYVPGIDEVFAEGARRGTLPSESGAPWASPPVRLDLSRYAAFRGTCCR